MDEVAIMRQLVKENQADSAFALASRMLEETKGESDMERAVALHMMGEMHSEKFEYEKSLNFLEQSQALSDEKGSDLYVQNRLVMARSHYYLGSLDEAKLLLNPLLEQQDLDSNYLYRAHYTMNNVYFGDSNDEKCLEHLIIAHDIAEKLGKENEAATIKSYLGFMYHRLDKDSIAFAMQEEALEYMMNVGDTIGAAFVLSERATMNNNIDDLEKAKKDYLMAIDFSLKGGHLPHAANCSSLLADVLVSLGEIDQALDYYKRSQKICTEYDIPIGILTNHIGLAELYFAKEDFQICIQEAERAAEIAKANDYDEELANANKILAKSYAMIGNYKKAYSTLSAQKAIVDSLFTLEKAESMAALREQFEREKNLREIEELENESRINKLKQKGLWLGLSLLALFSFLIINREVQRRKKARQLHETEMQLAAVEQSRMQEEIDFKDRELTSHALNLARKNEFLIKLKEQIIHIERDGDGVVKNIQGLRNELRIESQLENNWEVFTKQFTATNPKFYGDLKDSYSDLSKGDLRLAALLKMNLGTKEIANILGISNDGVKKSRYRLRKKLNLTTEDSLEEKIMMF